MRNHSARVLFAVFTLYTMGASASNKLDIQELKQRVVCLEERKGCCEERGCPTCSPDPEGDTAFYLWGEGLYWKAAESGIPFVNKTVTNDDGISVVSHTKHVPFDWHWGFRVGAGYNMCHDLWNIYATWTRYHFNTSKTVSLGPDRDPSLLGLPSLFAFWLPADFEGPYNSISSRWRVHLDQADLQIRREFYVTDYLSLSPRLGLRTAWIRQKFEFNAANTLDGGTVAEYDAKSNFWGFGIVAGLDTAWMLGCGFSIYGGAALSILDGHFESPYDYSVSAAGVVSSALDSTNHQNMAVVFTDLAIGLRYDKNFCCDRFRWAMWAGYEQHVYFEQNQFQNSEYSLSGATFADGGNLSTNGITVGMEFGF